MIDRKRRMVAVAAIFVALSLNRTDPLRAEVNVVEAERGTSAAPAMMDLLQIGDRWILHGIVPSIKEKREVERELEKGKGADVENLLQVVNATIVPQAVAMDGQLRLLAQLRLMDDPLTGPSNIRVASVYAGSVLLTGVARNAAEVREAIRVVGSIQGTKSVYPQGVEIGDEP